MKADCPYCGKFSTFEENRRVGFGYSESWLTCESCGSDTDEAELQQSTSANEHRHTEV